MSKVFGGRYRAAILLRTCFSLYFCINAGYFRHVRLLYHFNETMHFTQIRPIYTVNDECHKLELSINGSLSCTLQAYAHPCAKYLGKTTDTVLFSSFLQCPTIISYFDNQLFTKASLGQKSLTRPPFCFSLEVPLISSGNARAHPILVFPAELMFWRLRSV